MGREPHVLAFRKGELVLDHTVIMGIVNVTPDSFLDGGKYEEADVAVAHALRLAEQGAEVVDVGGESTRPGAIPVPAEEEWRRVGPVLKGLRARTDACISIDTYKPAVAAKALALGAGLVNDVSGLRDPEMMALVSREAAAAVIMHMRGEPARMQRDPRYGDVVCEVKEFLRERTEAALGAGIPRGSLLVDPGLGFGKSPTHNTAIVERLAEFRDLGFPVLVGPSGKWFGGGLGEGEAAFRAAVRNGADVVRVHDVSSAAKALRAMDPVPGTE